MGNMPINHRRSIAAVTAGNRLAFAFSLVLVLAALAVTMLCQGASAAVLGDGEAARPGPGETAPEETVPGGLFFRSDPMQHFRRAPSLKSEVRIRVSGMIARTELTQRFHNPRPEWQEGIYVFPLPEDAAVDRLRMIIGERVIEGRIAERSQAKRSYETAKQSGTKAGLIEQERPNIFTVSVANIGPGEEVSVEVGYRQSLSYDDGAFRIRFPMVVAPRYIPGAGEVLMASASALAPPTDQVPDAHRITPPVRPPQAGRANPLSLTVELAAGVALGEIESPTHRISVAPRDGNRFTITLEGEEVPADRDFELTWRPSAGAAPAAALFSEHRDGHSYVLLMVVPPRAEAAEGATRLPREVVFVIDTSGSMHGQSIDQAKQALALALTRLAEGDRFNIIQFNSISSALFRTARPATPATLREAFRYVAELDAQGGTEILPALRLALDGGRHPGRVRQVIFLTDGAVGNESALFEWIERHIGDSRLFTIGIGSAPNGYFMRKAASLGRGTFTYIGALDEVGEKMRALFEKLEKPLLTDLRLGWPEGSEAEFWPHPLPDLYHGEPLLISARLPRLEGAVSVSGNLGGRPWRTEVALGGGEHGGVAALWARKKIDAVLDGLRRGADPETVRAAVIELALANGLLTSYTSMVALDVTPTRPQSQALQQRPVPTNLPRGWDYDHVFGEDKPAAPAALRKASVRVRPSAATLAYNLPQTATAAPLWLALGLFSLLLGLMILRQALRRA